MNAEIKNPHHLNHPLLIKALEQGIKLDLKNISNTLQALDNPQNLFKSIHVAGTNGKGSTVFYISKALNSSKLKTGSFYSPHINTVCERIQVNNTYIKEERFWLILNKIHETEISLLEENSISNLTYFEVLTIAAFIYFAEEKVDYAVVETGMGGRFDSTNVLKPEIAVITTIALDHQQFLGNSLEEITKEKCGIIKKNLSVVAGELPEKLKDIIRSADAESFYFQKDDFKISGEKGQVYSSKDMPDKLNINHPFRSSYQDHNLANALKVIEILSARDSRIDIADFIKELPGISFRGRLDKISESPLIICDAAHNLAALKETFSYIANRFPQKRISSFFGFAADKNWHSMADYIVQNSDFATFLPFKNKRSLDYDIIRSYVLQQNKNKLRYAKSIESSFNPTDKNDLYLITGSFYLLDEAYKHLRAI